MAIVSKNNFYLWIFTFTCILNLLSVIRAQKCPAKIVYKKGDLTVSAVTQPSLLGEGPYWSTDSQKLYFVDIVGQKIHSYNPATEQIRSSSVANGPITFIIGVENSNNHFIVGVDKSMVLIKWNDNRNEIASVINTLATVDIDRSDTRFNDAKVDSHGRFWGGTMGIEIDSKVIPNRGSFYSIDEQLFVKKQISPVSISNGIAWNYNNEIMYYIDSPLKKVLMFEFDVQTGTISNSRTAFDFNKYNITGDPDGMTIDTNNNLWVAAHGAGLVLNIDPVQGKLLRTIEIPSRRVTSVTFGGAFLDTLYVTTASQGVTQEEKETKPHSGCVFTVDGLGVRGLSPNKFKLKMN